MDRRSLIAALAFVVTVAAAAPAAAGFYGPRQTYSAWRRSTTHGYHYRIYSYRPGPSQSGYRHHYVIHHPRYPKHCYFYNPVRRVYWGRCAVGQLGTGHYSLLAEADRKGDLDEIPESAFPAPGPMPIVPGAEDDLRLDPPPADLPPGTDHG